MTFAKSDNAFSGYSRPLNGRAALALAHALSDSQTREQIVPFGSNTLSGTAAPTYFDTLLDQKDCRDAWKAYTDVTTDAKFPQQLAQGRAHLNGFRHYTLQDAIYLEQYIRVRLDSIAAPGSKPSTADLKKFADEIQAAIGYSTSTQTLCEEQLGIQKAIIVDEWNIHRSTELNNSISFYDKVTKGQADSEYKKSTNPWLDIYFALLPCIKGYYEIAKNLPNARKNTLYYSLWIVRNQDDTFVKDYDNFISKNIVGAGTEEWAHYGRLFLQACNNEAAFFNLAISDYKEYEIVREGKDVAILPYGSTTDFLAPDNNDGITLKTQEVKWELVNNKDGYTIKAKDQNKFLHADVNTLKVTTVTEASKAVKWDINFTTKDKKYQLFVAGNVYLALDVKDKKVSLAEYAATQKGWSFK